MLKASTSLLINQRFTSLKLIGGQESTDFNSGDLVIRGGAAINGNVNIGGNLDIPSLSVESLQLTTNPVSGYVLKSDDFGNASWQEDLVTRWKDSPNGLDMYFNEGSIGLGVTEPEENLHVLNNIRTDENLIFGGTTSGYYRIEYKQDLHYYSHTSGSDVVFINSDGDVGIGTTATEKLDVLGDIKLSGDIKKSTETFVLPLSSDTLVGRISTDTLQNKTLVTPIISGNVQVNNSGQIKGILGPTDNNDAANKEYVDSLLQGLDWQESVITKGTSDPPVSPNIGDRYIISSVATGAWVGNEDSIAEYLGVTGWDITSPNEGFATWVEDEDVQYVYNGTSWVRLGSTLTHGNLIGLLNDDHTQYALLNGRNNGQYLYGGVNANARLFLDSTSNSTKGDILINPSGGNVGIGTTNAETSLHVVGTSTSFTNGGNQDEGIFIIPENTVDNSGGGRVFFKKSDDNQNGISLGYNGNVSNTILNWPEDTFCISSHNADSTGVVSLSINNSTQYVGIGNNNPSELLTIGSTGSLVEQKTLIQGAGSVKLLLNSDVNNSDSSKTSLIEMYQKGTTTKAIVGLSGTSDDIVSGTVADSLVIGGDEVGKLSDIHLVTDGKLRMTVKETGGVGIGVTNTNAGLHIQKITGSLGITSPELESSYQVIIEGDNTSEDTMSIGFKSNEIIGSIYVQEGVTGDVGDMVFNLNGDVSSQDMNEVMRLTYSKNVGIGTSSPTEKLDVNGNIKLSGDFIKNSETYTLPTSSDTLIGETSSNYLQNKTLSDSTVYFVNTSDNTKSLKVSLSGATSGTSMTLISNHIGNQSLTLPNATDTLVARNTIDTLTNKTLTQPIISQISNSGILTLPSGTTDTLVGRNTFDILTNKTFFNVSFQDNINVQEGYAVITEKVQALDSDGLQLYNISDQGILIDDNGNVLIGITSTSNILHVSGNTVKFDSNFDVSDNTLYVDNSTNRVGLGITNPTHLLHVNGQSKFDDKVYISGDLEISGTLTAINSDNISIQDSLIELSQGNTSDLIDIGFYGVYVDTGVTKYTGLFRDASGTKPYRLFKDLEDVPTTTINTLGTGYTKGDLILGDLNAETITYDTTLKIIKGDTKLYFDSNGKIGISTETPEAELTINGDLAVGEFGTTGYQGIELTGNDVIIAGKLGVASETALYSLSIGYNTTSTEGNLIVENSIGLGITSPSIPLHVGKSNIGGWSTRIQNNNANVYIANETGIGMNINTGITSSSLYAFKVRNNEFSDIFNVFNDGTVGINTNSASELLHIETTTVGEGLKCGSVFLGNNISSSDVAQFSNYNVHTTATSYAIKQESSGATHINSASSQQLTLNIGNTPHVYLSSSGNFGIGTVPSEKLHVIGKSILNGAVDIYGNLTVLGSITTIDSQSVEVTDPMIKLANGNNSNDEIDIGIYGEYGITGGSAYTGFFRDNADNKLKFFTGLEVEPGVTTIDTGATGYTDANIVCGNIESSGTIESTGTITALNFVSTSDRNLKKNIQVLDQQTCLSNINEMNIYKYQYKNHDDKYYHGIIAQEIENIIPDAVINKDQFKYVEYNTILTQLIGAVKQLTEETNILKNKLSRYE